MKTNTQTEGKELRAVVCSILIDFGTLAAIAVSISGLYFLPTDVIVGSYLLICAGIILAIWAVDHHP